MRRSNPWTVPALRAAFAAGAILCLGPGPICRADSGSDSSTTSAAPITDEKLPNGLEVILAPDDRVSDVAVCVGYRVGSADERTGDTGFAHLFEHMMFEGSENVGRGEYRVLIDDCGGIYNGTTSVDRTLYYETLPANQLRLALFLESDRMRSLNVNAETLANVKEVVLAEKRGLHDEVAYDAAWTATLRHIYSKFGYGHPAIGANGDIRQATLAQIQAFHDLYYGPNNAALVIAGKFDPGQARGLVAQYFGNIPAHGAPIPADTTESGLAQAARITLTDKLSLSPRIYTAYRIPPATDPDYPALRVLETILGSGPTARFETRILDSPFADGVEVFALSRRGTGIFVTRLDARSPQTVSAAESWLDHAMSDLLTHGVDDREVARAKARLRLETLATMSTSTKFADELCESATCFGDAQWETRLLSKVDQVSAADIQRVAKEYLSADHRVTVISMPYQPKPGGPVKHARK